jgi:hypothetical protein
MFKLGDLVKIIADAEIAYEVINVKNNGLLYDLKRSFDVLVLKDVPKEQIVSLALISMSRR